MFKNKWICNSAVILTIAAAQAHADDNKPYPFIALDFSQPASFTSNDDKAIAFAYAPGLALGLGLDHDLSTNWQVSNKISMHYTRADFTLTESLQPNIKPTYQAHNNGNADLTSLWVSSRLKRLHLFDNITPFIELGAGITKANYHIKNTRVDSNYLGYTAITGIEISTSSNATISLGVGYSDTDENMTFGNVNPQR